MRMLAWLLGVALILLSNQSGECLHEDEVGISEWRLESVGEIIAVAASQKGSHAKRRVFVGSAEGVVASLSLSTGNTMWRRIQERDAFVTSLAFASNSNVLVSAAELRNDGAKPSGVRVRGWDGKNGDLLWTARSNTSDIQGFLYLPPLQPQASESSTAETPTDVLYVFGANEVQRIHTKSGAVLASTRPLDIPPKTSIIDLATGASPTQLFALLRQEDTLRFVPLEETSERVIIFSQDVETVGVVLPQEEKASTDSTLCLRDNPSRSLVAMTSNGSVFFVSSEGKLKVAPMISKDVKGDPLDVNLNDAIDPTSPFFQIRKVSGVEDAIVAEDLDASAIILSSGKVAREGYRKSGFAGAMGPSFRDGVLSRDVMIVSTASVAKDEVIVEEIDLTSGKLKKTLLRIPKWGTTLRLAPRLVATMSAPEGDGSVVLIGSGDHSFTAIARDTKENAKQLWCREEAIARAQHIAFYTMPRSFVGHLKRSKHHNASIDETDPLPRPLLSFLVSPLELVRSVTWTLQSLALGLVRLPGAFVSSIMASLTPALPIRPNQGIEADSTSRTAPVLPLFSSYHTSWVAGESAKDRVSRALHLADMQSSARGKWGQRQHVFGKEEIIVLATCSGKLLGLHASTAMLLWQTQLVSPDLDSLTTCRRWRQRSQSSSGDFGTAGGAERKAAPFTLLHSLSLRWPEMVATLETCSVTSKKGGRGVTAVSQKRRLVWFDPIDGAVHTIEPVEQGVHIIPIHLPTWARKAALSSSATTLNAQREASSNGSRPPGKHSGLDSIHGDTDPVLLLHPNRSLQILPPSPSMSPLLSHHLRLHTIDTSKGVVELFKISANKSSMTAKRHAFLPFGEASRIIASSSVSQRLGSHVPVFVKADSSLLYKYLNPNLIGVVTEEDRKTKKPGKRYSLYLFDGATGGIVASEILPNHAKPPFTIVMCENWAAVHYATRLPEESGSDTLHPEASLGWEWHVVEMLDAKEDEGPWKIILNNWKRATQRKMEGFISSIIPSAHSHELVPPRVLSSSFSFPAAIRSAEVSSTRQGITSKVLLLALASDQLFALSRQLLNARRPNPIPPGAKKGTKRIPRTPEDDETALPYHPALPIHPTAILSHENRIAHLRIVGVQPSDMESTCLAVAAGLDLFFTPVQPARDFDVLSGSFNQPLLILSLTLLVTGVVVTSRMSKKAIIHAKLM